MFHSDHTGGWVAHTHFSLFGVLDGKGDLVVRTRVGHVPGAMGAFLAQFPEGTPVALETVGHGNCPVEAESMFPAGPARL